MALAKTLKSLVDELGFFSPTRAAAEELTQPRGPGPDFRKQLLKKGAFEEEIEETAGLPELLRQDFVTLDEIKNVLKENEVRVDEVYYRDRDNPENIFTFSEPEILSRDDYAKMRANDYVNFHIRSLKRFQENHSSDFESKATDDASKDKKIMMLWKAHDFDIDHALRSLRELRAGEMDENRMYSRLNKDPLGEKLDADIWKGLDREQDELTELKGLIRELTLKTSQRNETDTYSSPLADEVRIGLNNLKERLEEVDPGTMGELKIDRMQREVYEKAYKAFHNLYNLDEKPYYVRQVNYPERFNNPNVEKIEIIEDDAGFALRETTPVDERTMLSKYSTPYNPDMLLPASVHNWRRSGSTLDYDTIDEFIESFNRNDISNSYAHSLRLGETRRHSPSWRTFTVPGGDLYEMASFGLPKSYHGEFTGFHTFGGTGPNTFGHLRWTIRNLDGKKVMFVEEMQSDWSQKAYGLKKELQEAGRTPYEKATYRRPEAEAMEEGLKPLIDAQRELLLRQAEIALRQPNLSIRSPLGNHERYFDPEDVARRIMDEPDERIKRILTASDDDIENRLTNFWDDVIVKPDDGYHYPYDEVTAETMSGEWPRLPEASDNSRGDMVLKGATIITPTTGPHGRYDIEGGDIANLRLQTLLNANLRKIRNAVIDAGPEGEPNLTREGSWENFMGDTGLSENELDELFSLSTEPRTRHETSPSMLLEREAQFKKKFPEQPFIQSERWAQFAIKWLLTQAVKQDVDRLAFTTGQLQHNIYGHHNQYMNPDAYESFYKKLYTSGKEATADRKYKKNFVPAKMEELWKEQNEAWKTRGKYRGWEAEFPRRSGHNVHYDVIIPKNIYKVIEKYIPAKKNERVISLMDIKQSIPYSGDLSTREGRLRKAKIGTAGKAPREMAARERSEGDFKKMIYDYHKKVMVPYLNIDADIKRLVNEEGFKRFGLVHGGLVRARAALGGRALAEVVKLFKGDPLADSILANVQKNGFSPLKAQRLATEIRSTINLDDPEINSYVNLRTNVLLRAKEDRPYGAIDTDDKNVGMLYTPDELSNWNESEKLYQNNIQKLEEPERKLQRLLREGDTLDKAEWRDKFENYWFQGRNATKEDRNNFKHLLKELDIPNYIGIRQLSDQLPSRPSYSQRTVPLSREENLDEFLKDSVVKHKVYRTTSGGGEEEFDSMFVIPREVGPHFGTLGVANDLALSMMTMNIPKGGVGTQSRESIMEAFKQGEKKIEESYPFIMEGYINVRNPLYVPRDLGGWTADSILSKTLNNEFTLAKWVRESEGTVDAEDLKYLNSLTDNKFYEHLAKLAKMLDPNLEASRFDTQAFDLSPYRWDKINDMMGADPNIFVAGFLEKLSPEIKLRNWLQSKGFDSIQYRNEHERPFAGEPPDSFILFDPTQFKSSGASEFNPKDVRDTYAEGGEVREGYGIGGELFKLGKALSKSKKEDPIKAFHGSPHEFEKFSVEQIGTGEGHQGFGYGLYFAELAKVGKQYRMPHGPRPEDNDIIFAMNSVDTEARREKRTLQGNERAERAATRLEELAQGEARIGPNLTEELFGISGWDQGEQAARRISENDDLVKKMKKFITSPKNELVPVLGEDPLTRAELVDFGVRSTDDTNVLQDSFEIHLSFRRDKYRKLINSAEKVRDGYDPSGKLYEVNLDVNDSQLLDWDKLMGKQHSAVKKRARKLLKEVEDFNKIVKRLHKFTAKETGMRQQLSKVMDKLTLRPISMEAFNELSVPEFLRILEGTWKGIAPWGETAQKRRSIRAANSEKLSEAGIKGVKYYDGFSRRKKEGSRNYVIFDPRVIEISKIRGISIPFAAALLAKQDDDDSDL